MATAKTDLTTPEEVALKLDSLLKSRQDASSKPTVVEDSIAKAKLQRDLSADADCLTKEKKKEKIDNFLKHQKRRRRRRKKLTVNDVKAEAAKILEEFLQAQLQQNEIQTSSTEKRYERYVEASITEETTPSPSSSGYMASNSGMLREDSIPYADDSDQELMKAESLPHDDFMKKYFHKSNDKGLEIIHGKSKSAPYDGNQIEAAFNAPSKPRGHVPPPPAPPGTPHTPSEQGSVDMPVEMVDTVPYRGKTTDSSVPCSTDSAANSLEKRHSFGKRSTPPKAPTSLDIPVPLNKSRSTTPSDIPMSSESRSSSSPSKAATLPKTLPAKRRKDPSFASTDTEGENSDHNEHLGGRRKKSVFKKAQERLHIFFLKSKGKPERSDSEKFDNRQKVIKKKSKKTKKKKHGDEVDTPNKNEDKDFIEGERHIHTKKNIRQTHIGDDGSSVYRTEDGSEVVEYDSSSGKKHIKKEWKIKESTDNEKGFIGKLKRLTSRDKRRMKESKSMNIEHKSDRAPDYNRTVSVPYQQYNGSTQDVFVDDSDGFSVTGIEHSSHGNIEETHATQVVSKKDDMKRNSSHMDIVDHTGAMVQRMFFDEHGQPLPRRQSFEYELEECVHERTVKENGKVKVIRDVDTHSRMTMDEDVEVDGHSEEEEQRPLKELTEEEKEDLYGKIAERLAMIGDNLTVEREMELARSAASSPGYKLAAAEGGKEASPESEIKRVNLTQLETEIRDELRMVADEIDARLAADARQAAVRIAGIVTYNHFKNVVQESVGNEVGWAQVAAVFNITKRAIQLAGASGALAMQIKEMSLRYIEDKFANWIVAKGGWDSMLSEDDGSGSDDNYSDVD